MKAMKAVIGAILQPAVFTKFMGKYHNKEQPVIQTVDFIPDEEIREEIEPHIFINASHEATGLEIVHNEIIKVCPEVFADLIFQFCALVGRSKIYQWQLTTGVFTPLYNKGDKTIPALYRPLCML